MLPAAPLPDFRSPAFLRAHVLDTMAFYEGRCVDPTGGLYQFFLDDGRVYDPRTRHLVSSTRYVFTHAMAARHFARPDWQAVAGHALAFVRDVHGQPGHTGSGYAWTLDWHAGHATITDVTNHCYGLAFVLLAHAHAAMAGVPGARAGVDATWQLMEQRFWQPAHGLYADEADAAWHLSPYRGQNANMHACEALMAAYRATGDRRYLQRAGTVARAVTGTLAALSAGMAGIAPACTGLVWEHYRADWSLDPDYNRDDPANLFRPWGFQVGHQAEWAKLLLQLDALAPDPAWLPRARALFDAAMALGWDATHGGLVYGVAPDGTVCDGDKYHWVQAESLAAAAWLAQAVARAGGATPDARAAAAAQAASYWDWYDRLWTYAWTHFVDHEHGAWYRILAPDNRKVTTEKSPAGKVDYHDMGACYDVLAALGDGPPPLAN